MGAFDQLPPTTLPDPAYPEQAEAFRKRWGWDEHEQVILKSRVDVSDQEYVTNKYGKAKKGGDLDYQMGSGRFAILDRMLLSWTLTENGHPVPLNAMNIRRLPANYSNAILEVIDEMTKTMTEEEQEDFFPSANGHIVESSGSKRQLLKK